MVDAGRHFGRHRRLGMIGDAEAGGLQHRQVIGAVAHAHRVAGRQAALAGEALQGGELRFRAQDRPRHGAGQRRAVMFQHIGGIDIEAQRRAYHRREVGEAAGHERAIGTVLLHGRDQGGAPRHVAD